MKITRRNLLHTALGTPLLAGLGGLGQFAIMNPLSFDFLQLDSTVPAEMFPHPHDIRYDAQCFTLHDRDTFIYSAGMHYPRSPRGVWRDRLEKLKRAGFNTIQSYVFWNYHEPVEGHVDMSEFEEFIQLAGEMGFWLIARPGPYVCAEWDAGGFPHWVIAKQFTLRSNDPQSISTSQHWFDLVLPVIRRHQITQGGPIILMQIENEYDYWDLPDEAKRDYITALAEMAWKGGIEIPLITCWTKQVRERGNAAMSRIADFCNFYPRWNIADEVIPGLARLRKEEPYSPVGVTELQGGWFSQQGGKLSVDQPGVGPAQLNAIAKTVAEQGATFFNYYMGFGGTNFDWAGKQLTTTYDYAAPLREPGGLWGKYYEARGIGESLKLFGNVLTRAQAAESSPESNNSSVEVSLRMNGGSGVLFVRERADTEQIYKIGIAATGAASGETMIVPRHGDLVLGAREMKMLPVGIAIAGGHLHYTTAEVLVHGTAGRPYVILYDEPERAVEFALHYEREPSVTGETEYHEWDEARSDVVVGMRVGKTPKMALIAGSLQVVLLPRNLALRTWTAELSGEKTNAGGQAQEAAFISDAALLRETGRGEKNIWADLEFSTGEREILSLLPMRPTRCSLNGAAAEFKYAEEWKAARVRVHTPALPVRPVEIKGVETWVERFDTGMGHWQSTELKALEDLGQIPYGYVKYHGEFDYHGEAQLALNLFADDGAKIFVNGDFFAEVAAFGGRREIEFELAGAAKSGTNALDIAYELFGSPNGDWAMGELKGVKSASLVQGGGGSATKTEIGSWQIQTVPAAMRGRDIDPNFPPQGWKTAALSAGLAPAKPLPSFAWCRANFDLGVAPKNWQIPWKAHLEADCAALLYLNGKFVGRYVVIGPQSDFYLPDPYLHIGENAKNVLTVVLAYSENAAPIRALRIEPYEEFAIHRTRIEFGW